MPLDPILVCKSRKGESRSSIVTQIWDAMELTQCGQDQEQ